MILHTSHNQIATDRFNVITEWRNGAIKSKRIEMAILHFFSYLSNNFRVIAAHLRPLMTLSVPAQGGL